MSSLGRPRKSSLTTTSFAADAAPATALLATITVTTTTATTPCASLASSRKFYWQGVSPPRLVGVPSTENGLRRCRRRRQIKRQMRKLWIRTAWRLPKRAGAGAGAGTGVRAEKEAAARAGTVAATEVAAASRGDGAWG